MPSYEDELGQALLRDMNSAQKQFAMQITFVSGCAVLTLPPGHKVVPAGVVAALPGDHDHRDKQLPYSKPWRAPSAPPRYSVTSRICRR